MTTIFDLCFRVSIVSSHAIVQPESARDHAVEGFRCPPLLKYRPPPFLPLSLRPSFPLFHERVLSLVRYASSSCARCLIHHGVVVGVDWGLHWYYIPELDGRLPLQRCRLFGGTEQNAQQYVASISMHQIELVVD